MTEKHYSEALTAIGRIASQVNQIQDRLSELKSSMVDGLSRLRKAQGQAVSRIQANLLLVRTNALHDNFFIDCSTRTRYSNLVELTGEPPWVVGSGHESKAMFELFVLGLSFRKVTARHGVSLSTLNRWVRNDIYRMEQIATENKVVDESRSAFFAIHGSEFLYEVKPSPILHVVTWHDADGDESRSKRHISTSRMSSAGVLCAFGKRQRWASRLKGAGSAIVDCSECVTLASLHYGTEFAANGELVNAPPPDLDSLFLCDRTVHAIYLEGITSLSTLSSLGEDELSDKFGVRAAHEIADAISALRSKLPL